MFAVLENEIVARFADATACVFDNVVDGINFVVVVLRNFKRAARQKSLQVGLHDFGFRPVKDAVVVAGREVNHLVGRNENPVVRIKPATYADVIAAFGSAVMPIGIAHLFAKPFLMRNIS